MRLRLLAVCLPALFLGCDQVEYRPRLPDAAVVTVDHMGAYTSRLGDDEEEVNGTAFQDSWKWSYEKHGDGWIVRRRLDSLFGKGYHRLSMPNELEKKANLDIELGPDGLPRRITGYDSLHAVLARIEQRRDYREKLLRLSDTVRFQAEMRDAFRLRNLLPQGVLKSKTPIGVADANRVLETLKLDSARYLGEQTRLRRHCLEYEVYYHREDSLPLLVEQFFFSSAAHRKWKNSLWSPGRVDAFRHFSVERETGLPCFESVTETGHITLRDTTEKSEQPITLYRYEEDIYGPPPEG